MKRCVCFWDARRIGASFREHPLILGVEVYGSVARDGLGNDLDLILVVADDTARSFIDRMRSTMATRQWGIFKRRFSVTQKQVAHALLGEPFGQILAAAARAGIHVDVILFPPDWRLRAAELDRQLGNRPTFMQQVCRDAVQI